MTGETPDSPKVFAVAIGRNEEARLPACIETLKAQVDHVIYVDSGSDDGSIACAEGLGAQVVRLDTRIPFTAARARNAGFAAGQAAGAFDYVLFIDGDCALREGFVSAALAAFRSGEDIAAVCGRRRERFPEASLYNRLCDAEWDTPVGEARACGGDALMRCAPLGAVGGFREDLIAGEEPELCVRLRAGGFRILRIDAEMTWHDAAMHRFGQWWQRARRGGYAFARGAALHGAPPERHWVGDTRRALLWGAGLPLVLALATLCLTPWAALGFLLYPLQVLRLQARLRAEGVARRAALERAIFLTLAKFPEALGVIECRIDGWRGRGRGLIEYK